MNFKKYLFLTLLLSLFSCKNSTEISKTTSKNDLPKKVQVNNKPESLEDLQIALSSPKLKKRLDPSEIIISNLRVEEFTLLGQEGSYHAPALSFETSGGEADYYTFEACSLDGEDACLSGSFGESGQALCGVDPGKYKFTMQACYDSVWDKEASCSPKVSADNIFSLQNSSDIALSESMERKCVLSSQIKQEAIILYSKMTDPSNKSKSKILNELSENNCSIFISQIADLGPYAFSHLISVHGNLISSVAEDQLDQANEEPDSYAQKSTNKNNEEQTIFLAAGLGAFISAGLFWAGVTYKDLKKLSHPYKVTTFGEDGKVIGKTVYINKDEWKIIRADYDKIKDTLKPVNAEGLEAAKAKAFSNNNDLKVYTKESLKSDKLAKTTIYDHQSKNKIITEGTNQVNRKRAIATTFGFFGIGASIVGSVLIGKELSLTENKKAGCFSNPEIDSLLASLQEKIYLLEDLTNEIGELLAD